METLYSHITTSMALSLPQQPEASETTPPALGRVHLLPMGEFSARDGRPGNITGSTVHRWSLTPELAQALVVRWLARATPLVIDYEHQTQLACKNGNPAPAAGWITALGFTADGLFASVDWTDRAREYIRADEYRFISPTFSFDPKTGAVLELISAALTNNPALDGLHAVQATREDCMPEKPNTPEQATPAGPAVPITPDPERYVPKALADSLSAQLTTLTGEVARLSQTHAEAALTAEVEAALADGRLPQSCRDWAMATTCTHPDIVRGYIAAAPPIAALSVMQSAQNGSPEAPTASLTAEQEYVCSQLGLSADIFKETR